MNMFKKLLLVRKTNKLNKELDKFDKRTAELLQNMEKAKK